VGSSLADFQVSQLGARLHPGSYLVKAAEDILEDNNNPQQLEYDQHQDYYYHYDDYISHVPVSPMLALTWCRSLKDPLEQNY